MHIHYEDCGRATTAEEKAGPGLDLRKYSEAVLAHGSPPVQFVHTLMLDQPIPAAP
jgi:hypothetical protein